MLGWGCHRLTISRGHYRGHLWDHLWDPPQTLGLTCTLHIHCMHTTCILHAHYVYAHYTWVPSQKLGLTLEGIDEKAVLALQCVLRRSPNLRTLRLRPPEKSGWASGWRAADHSCLAAVIEAAQDGGNLLEELTVGPPPTHTQRGGAHCGTGEGV